MELFYCSCCGTVRLFNVFDIRKHGLTTVDESPCHVCASIGYFHSLDIADLLNPVKEGS